MKNLLLLVSLIATTTFSQLPVNFPVYNTTTTVVDNKVEDSGYSVYDPNSETPMMPTRVIRRVHGGYAVYNPSSTTPMMPTKVIRRNARQYAPTQFPVYRSAGY